MCTPVEYYHPILLCTSYKLLAGTFGNSFYQHFISLANATGVRLGRQTILQSDNLIQPTYLHLFRYIIRQMLGSIVPGRSEYLNMKAES